MIAPHDLRIPTGGNKNGIDTAGDGCGEDVCDLEADEEGEGHDDGGVLSVVVISGIGKVEIEVSQEGTGVCDEEGAERKDRSDKAVLGKLVFGLKARLGVLTLTSASIPRSLIIFHVSLAAAK